MGTVRAPKSAGGGRSGDRQPPRPDPVSPPGRLPRSGDVLQVTQEASVQFTDPIHFRVIRVHDWPTYHGWIWLDGYQLDADGDAVERRSIFVQIGGLHWVSGPPRSRPPARG